MLDIKENLNRYWTCLVCGTLNDRGHTCSHCGTPRPKGNIKLEGQE